MTITQRIQEAVSPLERGERDMVLALVRYLTRVCVKCGTRIGDELEFVVDPKGTPWHAVCYEAACQAASEGR